MYLYIASAFERFMEVLGTRADSNCQVRNFCLVYVRFTSQLLRLERFCCFRAYVYIRKYISISQSFVQAISQQLLIVIFAKFGMSIPIDPKACVGIFYELIIICTVKIIMFLIFMIHLS